MNYGDVFSTWRDLYKTEWTSYTKHPFVERIGDGTLPKSAFLNYLRQDYIFLKHFSRAWGLAIVKSGNITEMHTCSKVVHALLDEEIKLHIEFCNSEGISTDELEKTNEMHQNLAYTRFVLDAGFSGDFLDLMAALAPCVLGYGEIGKRLGASQYSSVYEKWITTYAGKDYQSLCVEVGTLIDNAVIIRLGGNYTSLGKFRELSQKFKIATLLEKNFWEMNNI